MNWSGRFGFLVLLLVAAMIFAGSGCGRSDLPPLGRVRGTVTLDGKPLAGAVLHFQPEKGRPALANTDGQGNYEVSYVDGVKGTTLGTNKVRVLWPEGEKGSAPIPEKYGSKSTLTVDVKAGNNTFDVKMDSK